MRKNMGVVGGRKIEVMFGLQVCHVCERSDVVEEDQGGVTLGVAIVVAESRCWAGRLRDV